MRTTGKNFFEIPMPKVFEIFETWINLTRVFYGIRTHHFYLMSNHIHWLLTTPNSNIDDGMRYIFSSTAKEVNEISGSTGHLWGGRYKYSLIKTPEAYIANVKYAYRNACRANMVSRVDHYPYSTLQFLYGLGPAKIMLSPDPFNLSVNYDHGFLDWLNTPFKKESHKQMDLSLKRKRFEFRRIRRRSRYEIELPPGWPKSGR
jgi:putative transposase